MRDEILWVFDKEMVKGTVQCTSSFSGSSKVGLGVVPGERSFFHKNERNDPIVMKERIERFLNNVGTICKGTERKFLKRTFKIRNAFIFSRMRSKLRTHFKSGMCSKSSRNDWKIFLFDHLNPPLSALPHSMIMKGFGFKNKIFTNKIFSQCSVALKTCQYKYINTHIYYQS